MKLPDLGNHEVCMTLAELADRTALLPRQLRYVLDHGLLPVGKIERRGRGSPRTFTEFEAFGIACAALMLEAGLRQSVVRDCVGLLCRYAGETRRVTDVPLFKAFQPHKLARLEVGDGVNVRLHGSGPLSHQRFDTGWQQIATGAQLAGDYEP